MIIDGHVHAGTGDGLTGPWDTAAPLGPYAERARAAGIGRSVLFSAFHSDYATANAEVARIVARDPDRWVGFVFVNPEADRGRVGAMVRHYVLRRGFRGIKVHRHQAAITREVCEVARALSVPVLYDVGGKVAQVHLLAEEYPDVAFIIPHLGSFADDWAAQRALVDLLPRYANVFTDSSGVRRFDLLEDAVRVAGPSRLIFGSDGPWLHPGVELAKIRALGLRPAALAQVLGGNMQRLLDRASYAAMSLAPAARLAPRPSIHSRRDQRPWTE